MNMPYPFHRFLLRYGMAGLPANASDKARKWETRLNWPLFTALCLAIPAFYIELSAVDRTLLSWARPSCSSSPSPSPPT